MRLRNFLQLLTMAFDIVDPTDFLDNGLFLEQKFLAKADEHDWAGYRDKKVLVRGCQSAIVPPWAYMLITGRLAPFARSVRFGNEHDNMVVFRKAKTLDS